MNSDIEYVGSYRFKENARHHEPYWSSSVVIGGEQDKIVDAAGATPDGRNIVRLLPYGANNREMDGLLQDGDLLGYTKEPLMINLNSLSSVDSRSIGAIIKGRVSHAEIGYPDDCGRPRQVSLWGAPGLIRPYDRPFHEHACDDAISIYRVSLSGYGIDSRSEKLLKAETKRWRHIVQPVCFPTDTMNVDPVDFTTVDDLRRIAASLIAHSPTDGRAPLGFKLNCVQWSTLVLSLAVCCPLSHSTLEKLDMLADYERNWSNTLGFAEDGLVGLDELPIPFYTVFEAVENTVDLYLPRVRAEVLKMVDPDEVARRLSSAGIRSDQRTIMPAAFMIENRLRFAGVQRKTKSVFEYVATAVPEGELEKAGS